MFTAINLGDSPVANRLQSQIDLSPARYPLELRICSDCSLGQLGEFQSAEEIFTDYPYLSSTSQTWLNSNRVFAQNLIETLGLNSEDLVVELASNDGYLLKFFQESGVPVMGVEPANNIADLAILGGIPTTKSFFGLDVARELKTKQLNPRVVIAKNVIAHVPDLQDFVSGLSELASRDTLLIIEAPTISQIISDYQFDTIYHEHFSYVSGLSLKTIFSKFDLEIFGAEYLDTHGGSIRFFARRLGGSPSPDARQRNTWEKILETESDLRINEESTWNAVRGQVNKVLSNFREWLESGDSETTTVAYGAAAKGVTLLAASKSKIDAIDQVIDNSEAKIGKFFPLTKARIVSEEGFILQMDGQKRRYIIFPWNLIDELIPRIKSFDPDAEIFTALPFPRGA
jgi:hypothetical protein